MIGGKEIVIPHQHPNVAIFIATLVVMDHWPDCEVEKDEPFNGELFISKTAEASKLWDTLGACEATKGTLIHLLTGQTTLTVVVDDEPNEEINQIISDIRVCLE